MNVKARMRALRSALTREKLAAKLRRARRALLNPRLLVCITIAWMLTNGWSYVLFGLGMLWRINWMRAVGGAYMGFLWLPFTPEKLVTAALALLLLRLLYPRDAETLGLLRGKLMRFRRSRGVE